MAAVASTIPSQLQSTFTGITSYSVMTEDSVAHIFLAAGLPCLCFDTRQRTLNAGICAHTVNRFTQSHSAIVRWPRVRSVPFSCVWHPNSLTTLPCSGYFSQ